VTARLLIFAKTPRLGRVKRRLAAELGTVAAWRFQRHVHGAVLGRLAADPRWRATLFVTPDRFAAAGRFWPPAISRAPQGQGDLGARMMRAFRALPDGPAVLVGSDIPELRAAHVARAFTHLRRHDAVFGPARDGGYWLVGLRHPRRHADLFQGVRWSGPHALSDTAANIRPGHRVAYLDPLEDIDDAAAHARWRARVRSGRSPDAPGAGA
jgi:rSAM/selenodomain-associated transferase 1